LKYSYDKWTQGDDSVVDDISFVLIFLHCWIHHPWIWNFPQ
jgi:hypothetical protein